VSGTWSGTGDLTPHALMARRRCLPNGEVLVAGESSRPPVVTDLNDQDTGT